MTAEERLDNRSPSIFGQTPSQTVGPFFHYSLPWRGGADLVGQSDLGARTDLFPPEHDLLTASPPRRSSGGKAIEIVGRITDGQGDPVPDAMLEIWQADGQGIYPGPPGFSADGRFPGFGRCATAEDGSFCIRTLYPGRVPVAGDGLQAPHIAVSVFGRGILNRLYTRLYFAGGEGNEDDPVLACVPAQRRQSLLAVSEGDDRWRFDIRLQGEQETVFFAL